jgi:hypothetical protein
MQVGCRPCTVLQHCILTNLGAQLQIQTGPAACQICISTCKNGMCGALSRLKKHQSATFSITEHQKLIRVSILQYPLAGMLRTE